VVKETEKRTKLNQPRMGTTDKLFLDLDGDQAEPASHGNNRESTVQWAAM